MGGLWETRGKNLQNPLKFKLRREKKVLSLVLCVAVMLSVMVLGAGAAFLDQDKIENTEAVDACSALNIIGGYEDGSYHPERNIKRSEVTKMICVALNGGSEPNLAAPATPTFTDVRGTSDSWAEKYIEYCVAQGIVSGVGDNRFSPAGNVTGTQLAKMLLVCLGYDADIENFTGTAWDTNVNVRASQKGLYEGLETLDPSVAVTRDQAAQMVWNAMQAVEVEYTYTLVSENGQLVSKPVVGDKENDPTLLESKYDAVIADEGAILTKVEQDDKGTYTVTTTGEKGATYTKVANDYSALMGQSVDVMYKTDKLDKVFGIYANEDSSVVATGVVGDLDTVSGSTDKVKLDSTEYKIDSSADVYNFNKTARADTLMDLAKSHDGVQRAYSIKLIDNDGNGKVDRAIVSPFVVAEVTYVGTSSMTFTSVADFTAINNQDVEDITAYDGIAEDDWAIVYLADDTVDGNYNVEKATIVTGEVTGTRDGGKEGLIDGTWYTSLVAGETFNVGDKVDVVTVGEYAFNVEISDTTTTSADVLYVDGLEIKTGLNAGLNAKLYFTDGTSKEALISKIDTYDVVTTGTAAAGEVLVSKESTDSGTAGSASYSMALDSIVDRVYTFTTDGDKYEIKSISNDNKAGYKGYDKVKSYADKTLNLTNDGTAKISDSAVIFVEGADDTKVVAGSVVNAWGKDKIEFTADNSIMMYSESNGFKYAQLGSLKLADGKDIPDASGDTAYGYVTADPYLIKEGSTNYIQYTLWTVDGEKTVRVKTSTFEAAKGDFISYNVGDGTTIKEVNKDALTAGAVTAYADGEDINMINADQSAITGFANKLADDVTVVYVNTKDTKGVDGGKIRTATKNSNGAYIANVMYVLNTDKEVDVLFVDVNNDMDVTYTPSAGASTADINNALKAGDVDISNTLTAASGTIEVPKNSTLTISANQTQTFDVTVADGATVHVKNEVSLADTTVTIAAGGSLETEVATSSSSTLVGPENARIVTSAGTNVTVVFAGSSNAVMTIAGNATIPAGQTWFAMFGPEAATATELDMKVTSGTLTVNGTLKLIKGTTGSSLTVSGTGKVVVGTNGLINVASLANLTGNNAVVGTDATSKLTVANGTGTINGVNGVSDHNANAYTWDSEKSTWTTGA